MIELEKSTDSVDQFTFMNTGNLIIYYNYIIICDCNICVCDIELGFIRCSLLQFDFFLADITLTFSF